MNAILRDKSSTSFRSEVSHSNSSVGQIRTYKVTRWPHCDADATMAVPQPYKKQSIERNPFSAQNQTLRSYRVYISPTKEASSALIQTRNSFYILFPAKGIVSYRQIISSCLYVRLKGTCSLVGQALSNTGE